MKKLIDKTEVKISGGRVYIDEAVELGDDLVIQVRGSIVKKEVFDNQDGSVNIVYIFKAAVAEVVKI